MMRFAAEAARFFESVEIVELHHPDKADAPVRHRSAYGGADRRRATRGRARRRCPTRPRPASTARAGRTSTASTCTACGCAAWSPTRRSCSGAGGDPDHPARLPRPRVVHARACSRAARDRGPPRPDRRASSTSSTSTEGLVSLQVCAMHDHAPRGLGLPERADRERVEPKDPSQASAHSSVERNLHAHPCRPRHPGT